MEIPPGLLDRPLVLTPFTRLCICAFCVSSLEAEKLNVRNSDPALPAGQRFYRDGMQNSTVPRLYHSSATLLPDGSVLSSGSCVFKRSERE